MANAVAFVDALDLRKITLVVHDWGGPIGLVNATEMPERFSRLVILNTWLHHDTYEYTDPLRAWNKRAPSVDFSKMGGAPFAGSPDSPDIIQAGYSAPFEGPETQAGARRWPWMLPFMNPKEGGAARQAKAYHALASWRKPAHVIFGDSDQVMLDYAEARGRPVHVLLTKSDKLGRNEARSTLQKTRALLGERAGVQLFSAESGEGIDAAQGALAALLAGRA